MKQILESFEIAGIEIYQIQDGTWRVRSDWGEKVRNIETLSQALDIAEEMDAKRPY